MDPCDVVQIVSNNVCVVCGCCVVVSRVVGIWSQYGWIVNSDRQKQGEAKQLRPCCRGVGCYIMGSRVVVQIVDNNVCIVRCGVWYDVSIQTDNDCVEVETDDKTSVHIDKRSK